MRTDAMQWMVSWALMLALGLLLTLALVGCESAGDPPVQPPLATPAPAPAPGSSATRAQQEADDSAEARSRAMAEQLAANLDERHRQAMAAELDPFADAPPFGDRPAVPVAPPAPAAPAAPPAEPASLEVAAPAVEPTTAAVVPEPTPEPVAAPPSPPDAATFSRAELLSALAQQLEADDDSALGKAVTAAALSLADPGGAIDPRLLDPLKPLQREAVERVRQLFAAVQKQAREGASDADSAMAAASGGITRRSLIAAVTDVFADQPVTITHADLCGSVHSYGAYEPLDSHTFLSGETNRAIVYVEVDNFAAAPLDSGLREVKLTQELILYKESDGLAVWRHEPTEILDVSRNLRRDFYTVQMMTLPARLGEGKYRLKIRLTDRHGDSVDETTLPLEVVADASMIDAAAQR